MTRVCFIVNPAAGRGRGLKTWKRVQPLAASLGGCTAKFTERPGHGVLLARQAVEEGYDPVVALGGDGTINEVGNALAGSGTAMGVVPTGTGNGWVRTVGVPLDPLAATHIVYHGRRVRMDVGRAAGHRCFLNVAGIGLDAEAARQLEEHTSVPKAVGTFAPWVLAVARALLWFNGVSVTAELDGKPVVIDRMFVMTVGIGRYYAYTLKVLPDARMDDGLFDVLWCAGVGKVELIGLIMKALRGAHVGDPRVTFARCTRLTAAASSRVSFHLDGDLAGDLPITFEVVPGALEVIVP